MNQQPPIPTNSPPVSRNHTPLAAKIAGILCGAAAFAVFVLMFITDCYDRIAVLSGILSAICAYSIYRQDTIYPALSRKNSLGRRDDRLPPVFCVCWTLIGLVITASLVAWALFATPIAERVRHMFFGA